MDLTVDHKHLLSIYFRRSTGEQSAFSVWLCNLLNKRGQESAMYASLLNKQFTQ